MLKINNKTEFLNEQLEKKQNLPKEQLECKEKLQTENLKRKKNYSWKKLNKRKGSMTETWHLKVADGTRNWKDEAFTRIKIGIWMITMGHPSWWQGTLHDQVQLQKIRKTHSPRCPKIHFHRFFALNFNI